MTLSSVATVAKTLGHPGRLRILTLLRDGPLSVCQIATILSAPPSTISGHLSELRRAGVVCEQRAGKRIYCRLSDDHTVAALLGPLFAALAEDGDIRRDAATASALRCQPPAAVHGEARVRTEASMISVARKHGEPR
jgi:DNA-binding transcriptional ArsR family regulator